MHSESPAINPTRQRLLDAAVRVCAERGLHGATTREIAEAAGVNEVTLFRHFGSKEKLISEIFRRAVSAQMESLSETEPDANDLERDLMRYARRYDEMLMSNEPLIRTLIGEARRHPQEAWQVICEAARPMRERLIGYLRAAQKAGSVRTDIPLGATIDAFTGMLLAGMLRRTSFKQAMADYSPDEYVANAVELFLRGIAAPDAPRKTKPAPAGCQPAATDRKLAVARRKSALASRKGVHA
jgi:AcrR family transcriptional regulator